MTRKVGLPLVAGLAVLLASGTLFAAAQSEQRQGANEKDTAVQAIAVSPSNDTAAQAIAVSPANDIGAFKRPQGHSVMAMTKAQCNGLGGVVGGSREKTCGTKKSCYTANADGVVRETCITEE